MTSSPDNENRLEILKLKAERARLAAERAALEAETLKFEARQLQAKASADQASSQESELGQESSAESSAEEPPRPRDVSLRVVGAKWPLQKGKFHRFVGDAETPGFFGCKTREIFAGERREGVYEGTYRLQFTLPGEDNKPKTIELLQTSKGSPSFAAIRVSVRSLTTAISQPREFFIDASIAQFTNEFDRSSKHLVVSEVNDKIENPSLKKGDIIRAVSVAKDIQVDAQGSLAVLEKFRRGLQKAAVLSLPDLEEGMAILDNNAFQGFESSLKENLRVSGQQAEVVLLIERPDQEVFR